MNLFDTLAERGFVFQTTDQDSLREMLDAGPITGYVGFDPTADSLHAGNLIPIMMLAHLQRAGHRPVAIVGGGTALVGDPSGRTEMRNLMTLEQIEENLRGIRAQLAHYVDFEAGEQAAVMVNNADWLARLNYVEF